MAAPSRRSWTPRKAEPARSGAESKVLRPQKRFLLLCGGGS
ncbi:hypothetical protein [Ectobacillus panaciterrae]|nr:hypothetical protein [Ectobacillus panaciterrae]